LNNINFDFERIIELINNSDKICIITHNNPDGDAIGSSLGLYNTLINFMKNVSVVVPNNYAEFLKWMPSKNIVVDYYSMKDKAIKIINNSDLIIALDFNELKRTGKLFEVLQQNIAKKILIDHHPCPELVFDVIISDTTVSSTAELVYEVLTNCGLEKYINSYAAQCLYAGILTDTLSFSVNCNNARTFEIASKLLTYNIDREKIHSNIFNNFSENRIKLLGYALNQKMEIINEYSTGIIWLTKEEQKQFQFKVGDSEGFVNYPLSIKGVVFSALFMERDDHVKISFRSKGNFAVNEIMRKHFTGGGHKNAAGGEEYNLKIIDTVQKFKNILHEYSAELQNKDD